MNNESRIVELFNMKNYNQEVEDLLIMERSISESNFDKYLDYYLTQSEEKEKVFRNAYSS